jgi:multidrug efflux pump subunit AcrA (membrane-fusion protein)
MYAEATLHLDQKDHAIAVPLQAVGHDGTETTVDVVGADGKIEVRHVALGIQTANDAEVLSGLHVGELVVVGDRGGLKPGQTVRTQIVELMSHDDTASK